MSLSDRFKKKREVPALPAPEKRLALPAPEKRLALPAPEKRLALPAPEAYEKYLPAVAPPTDYFKKGLEAERDRLVEEEKRTYLKEKEYNDKLARMQTGQADLDAGHTRCQNPRCLAVYRITEPRCPKCHYPNSEFRLEPNQTICPICQDVFNINAPACHKGHLNKVKPQLTNLRNVTSKNIIGKIYEIVTLVLIGAFMILGLPFFGFPSLPFLGLVFIILMPLSSLLPSERDIISSVGRGEKEFESEQEFFLIFKGMVRIAEFSFIAFQFFILPISKLVPLVISFVFYIGLPTSYKTTQPFRMVEAWFRVVIGFIMAGLMFMAFLGTQQALTLTLMTIAFFGLAFPRHKDAEAEDSGSPRVEVLEGDLRKILKGGKDSPLDLILNIAFFVIMTLALLYANVGTTAQLTLGLGILLGFGALMLILQMPTSTVTPMILIAFLVLLVLSGALSGNMFQIMFYAIWILSVVVGLTAGKEGRPASGILMILMTLFVFSFTSTGVMGQAVFGYWWPQVQAFGETVAAPLGPIMEQVQTSSSDMWLMLTNPMAYYDLMNKRSQATKSVVKEGGTSKSIELTKSDLFTSVPGELDPLYDPVVGSFEVQNQGEFYANSIHLLLWASWTDPLAASATNPPVPIPIGTLSNFVCSTGSPSSTPGKCDWTQTTYPEEMKIVNFVFDKNYWDLGNGDNLANCINYDKNSLPCDDPSGNATYAHSGQTVKINANITYDYNVNVSIPVDVIDFTVYQKLLQANEITLQDLTSQYTGGPVKATLWSQRQPIRAGETSLFVASIYNEGDGEIESIGGFSIKIPTALGTPTIVSSTFYTGSIGNDGCNLNQNEIFCQHNVAGSGIKTGEYRRVSFFITPTTTQGVDRISRLITGLATYKYVKTVSKSITVANAPLH